MTMQKPDKEWSEPTLYQPDVSAGLALGTSLPPIWPVLVIDTSIWIIIMTAVALWRFGKEEF